MRQKQHMHDDDIRRNPVQAFSQESISLQRAAQVYGTRAFIPVASNVAPNTEYHLLKEKRR
ncbi:hypothetical protein [Alcaligenes sp. WGS1538]|uniref:hypothetical protein n=1 Tax=Alcaligenes sp. WGS1538 TaxID=3366811 RepID=UPI00372D3190